MDYNALKTELQAPIYQSLSDNAAADLMNGLNYTSVQSRFITARTILAEIAGGAQILDKMEAASSQVSELKWAMKFLQQDGGLDVGHPNTQAQLTAMTGTVLTADEATALKNMAMLPVSRAELLGLGSVNYNDVNIARAM